MRVLLVLLLTAGCTPSPADPPGARGADGRPDSLSADSLTGVFEGWYSAGFEHTGFRPCADTTETWWAEPALEFDGEPVAPESFADVGARYERLFGPDGGGRFTEGPVVWARLRGRATPLERRTHGHLGQYDRRFLVDSILAMTAEAGAGQADACARPGTVRP